MKKTLMAAAVLVLAGFSATSMAAGEVSLIKAASFSSYYHGFSWEDGRFEAQVANLGYAKQVTAYVKRTSGAWVDYPLSYLHSSGGNKEVWAAEFHNESWVTGRKDLTDTGDIIEFAIKYTVNGQTYWDNNGTANYKLPHGAGTLLGAGKNVSVYEFAPTLNVGQGTAAYGHVTVRNLSPTKTVNIIYTTNNWATTKTATATYSPYWYQGYSSTPNPNTLGFEEWAFTLDVSTGTQLQYAVSYTVNGQTYWDNNGGANYVSTISRQ